MFQYLKMLWDSVRFFQVEDICHPVTQQPYLRRYVLFGSSLVAVYLHKFIASDFGRDPHNHPRTFISFGLRGSYIEEIHYVSSGQSGDWQNHFRIAPFINLIPHDRIHRIKSPRDCWTLCVGGPVTHEWGFFDKEYNYTSAKTYIANLQKQAHL